MYGFTVNFTGFTASFVGSLWLVFFSISPMEKQAINFQKLFTMCDHAVKSELSHGHFIFSLIQNTEND